MIPPPPHSSHPLVLPHTILCIPRTNGIIDIWNLNNYNMYQDFDYMYFLSTLDIFYVKPLFNIISFKNKMTFMQYQPILNEVLSSNIYFWPCKKSFNCNLWYNKSNMQNYINKVNSKYTRIQKKAFPTTCLCDNISNIFQNWWIKPWQEQVKNRYMYM